MVAGNWVDDDHPFREPGTYTLDECRAIARIVKQQPRPPVDLLTCPYPDYLRSERWSALRSAALSRDKCCRLCGAEDSLEVHHIHYRFRGVTYTVLCASHHEGYHRVLAAKKLP